MAASGTHPCYSATIPVAAPVGPEPPSRLSLPEETTSLSPRADGQRASAPQTSFGEPGGLRYARPFKVRRFQAIWGDLGNGFWWSVHRAQTSADVARRITLAITEAVS